MNRASPVCLPSQCASWFTRPCAIASMRAASRSRTCSTYAAIAPTVTSTTIIPATSHCGRSSRSGGIAVASTGVAAALGRASGRRRSAT